MTSSAETAAAAAGTIAWDKVAWVVICVALVWFVIWLFWEG